MTDLTTLNESVEKTQSVTFKDGGAFNFNDNMSIYIICMRDTYHPTSTFQHCTESPASILRSSLKNLGSVSSKVTLDTGVGDSETSVNQIPSNTSEILKLLPENNKDKAKASYIEK